MNIIFESSLSSKWIHLSFLPYSLIWTENEGIREEKRREIFSATKGASENKGFKNHYTLFISYALMEQLMMIKPG
jgi:hypothetical protein